MHIILNSTPWRTATASTGESRHLGPFSARGCRPVRGKWILSLLFGLGAIANAAPAQTSYRGIWDFQVQSATGDAKSTLGGSLTAEMEEPQTPEPDLDSSVSEAKYPFATSPVDAQRIDQPVLEKKTNSDPEGWFPPPQPPGPRGVEPNRFREGAKANLLIPLTPTENSFTSQSDRIESESLQAVESPETTATDFLQHTPDSSEDSRTPDFSPHASSTESTAESEPFSDSEPQGNNVASVAFEQTMSAADATKTEQEALATAQTQIVRFAVSRDSDSNLGTTIRLIDLVRHSVPNPRRAEMIGQYWETWSKQAELQSLTEYKTWLNSIGTPWSPSDEQLLNQIRSSTDNQISEAKTNLFDAQAKLQTYVVAQQPSRDPPSLRPVPSDLPLVHQYVTNYQLYCQYLPMPQRFQNIDVQLSETLKQITSHASSAQSAKRAAEAQLSQVPPGQANLNAVLESARRWRTAERAMIASVAQYNRCIADYALNVTDGRQSPETVVAMLIGREDRRAMSETELPAWNSPAISPQNSAQKKLANPSTLPAGASRTPANWSFDPASSNQEKTLDAIMPPDNSSPGRNDRQPDFAGGMRDALPNSPPAEPKATSTTPASSFQPPNFNREAKNESTDRSTGGARPDPQFAPFRPGNSLSPLPSAAADRPDLQSKQNDPKSSTFLAPMNFKPINPSPNNE